MKNINTKITAIRHLRRYTQEEAAERSHIAIRTYQRLESGACSPRLGHLESLAAGLQCSIEDILYFNLEQNAFPEKNGSDTCVGAGVCTTASGGKFSSSDGWIGAQSRGGVNATCTLVIEHWTFIIQIMSNFQ